MKTVSHTLPFAELRSADVARVGGKNASLGEMIQHMGRIPRC